VSTVRTLARLARILEHSSIDLSMPQYRLLAMVAEGDERASALAGRLTLSKPTITAAVDGLVERGLVTRGDVAGDRRAVRITITAAGRRALQAAERSMQERLNGVLTHCADRAAVEQALDQLGDALDAALAERLREGATR
jgi:DNA-binding MarR family transcriptional regulator